MTYHADPSRYDRMSYNRCGRSGLKLPPSALGYGTILAMTRRMTPSARSAGRHLTMASRISIWPTITARPPAAPKRRLVIC